MGRITASLLFAFCAQQVIAQDVPLSAGREAAARELVEIMNLERQMIGGATAMMDAMVLQSPQLNAYRDVILGWAESVILGGVWAEVRDDVHRGVYRARIAGSDCVLSYAHGTEGPYPAAGAR